MRWLFALMIVLASPTDVLARAAGMVPKEPHPIKATASVLPSLSVPTITLPEYNTWGGCGRGRYRDAETHRCRGPADIGN
jgi:hypothetical protein